MVDKNFWGKNKGCDFLNNSCKNNKYKEFCK